MAFCKICDREVGIEKKSRAIWIIGLLILGAVLPFWIVTLPLFWGLALLAAIIPRKKTCGICKSSI